MGEKRAKTRQSLERGTSVREKCKLLEQDKYRFTGECKEVIEFNKVYRIQAKHRFRTADGRVVNAGDYGGWIECADNLNGKLKSNAWVAGEAVAYGKTRVTDNALVADEAEVWSSRIKGNAQVRGNARVYGSTVAQNAIVTNQAKAFFMKLDGNTVMEGNEYINGAAQKQTA